MALTKFATPDPSNLQELFLYLGDVTDGLAYAIVLLGIFLIILLRNRKDLINGFLTGGLLTFTLALLFFAASFITWKILATSLAIFIISLLTALMSKA